MKTKLNTIILAFIMAGSGIILDSCSTAGKEKLTSEESLKFKFIPRVSYNSYYDDERLMGLIQFCKLTGASEVMLVPVASGEPVWLPEDKIIERVNHTKNTIKTLKEHGIDVSVNVLRVLMPKSGQEPIHDQGMVNREGNLRNAPCPLDKKYRNYMHFFFSKLGETGADNIFVDDDFSHYIKSSGSGFCPLHIQEFNKRHGYNFTRENLVNKLKEDPFGKVSLDWAGFQADVLIELAGKWEKAVHDVDPDIRMGLMLTYSNLAAYGGKSREVVEAFAGNLRPLVRPGMGCYRDYDRIKFISHLTDVLFQISRLPEETEIYAEIDAVPHSFFSKGIKTTFDYPIKANLVCGIETNTIWWLKREEYLDEKYPYNDKILKCFKVHRTIAEIIPRDAELEGIGIVKSEIGRRWSYEGHYEAVTLWRMGIPFTFNEKSETVVLTKKSIIFETEEVERYFREKNVLVDLEAFETLNEMGMGNFINVENKRIEEPIRLEQGDRRIAVLPYNLTDYINLTLQKKENLKELLEWLNGGYLPVFIDDVADVCPTILTDRKTGRKVVGLINCSYDPAIDCDLYVQKNGNEKYILEYISDDGSIKEIPGNSVKEVNDYIVIHLTEETCANPFDVRVITLIPVDK
ncbi:hypothetical protein ACFLSA_06085 [Bacteroidota bacterium]